MADTPHTSDRKLNNSLVWKLSFAQVRRIFAVCNQINFWVVLLAAIGIIYWGELQGLIAYQQQPIITGQLQSEQGILPSNTTYQIVPSPQGVHIGRLRVGSYDIIAPESFRTVRYTTSPLQEQLPEIYDTPLNIFPEKTPLYTVYLPLEAGGYLRASTDLGHLISLFLTFFIFILLLETVLILSNLWKSQRTVIEMLRPIYDLTATTELISSVDMSLPLSGTIDALNNINEKHLDRRISIADERSELQGLAFAINNMLDRLDASYQAQLRFVSDASHELRTPISIIQGYAGLLERWGKDDPDILEESISAIKNESQDMQKLVEQLLFLARSDNQTLQMKREVFNLSQLMEEVVKETQMITSTHQITSQITPDLLVDGDYQLIKQSVRVLVENSTKYTPEGGEIGIILEPDDGTKDIAIRVSDTGIGMSEEEISHVFERFWRADEARNRKTGGTGLGLAIAKRIVDSHQGYLQIFSREGLGTRFSILLPAATKPKEVPIEDNDENTIEKPEKPTKEKVKKFK